MKKYLYLILALAMTACGSQNNEESKEEEHEESGMTDVTLTDAQTQQLKLQTGTLPLHEFPGLIEANGTLAVTPESEALVSPYVGANVKSILVKEGQRVSKGQALATLSHPDLLELQSRYLQAYNRMAYVSKEYERQKGLYAEKIGSGKDFQQIQSEYRTLQSEISTTASQLQMLGISVSALQNGKTVNTITATAPISGMVETVLVKTGQYADSQTPMFRIINTDNLYADLLVFEKDVPKVQKGQKVSLSLKSACGDHYTGTVFSVGNSFESNPKAVHVRVNLDKGSCSDQLISGMYLCGKIATSPQQLRSIPSEGVTDDSGKSYIFTVKKEKGKTVFHPIEVKKGREENGYIELLNSADLPQSATYALNNAYYIISEMKKSETGEDD